MSLMPGYPVPRAQWATSGEACTACGKRFSFFTSKENCPCCGRLFCSSCLSAECTLTPVGLPSVICLECFQKAQDWRRSKREQRREAQLASPSPAAVGASPPFNSELEARLTMLEGELARVKGNGHQLRGENDSLLALLATKDTCIVELTKERERASAAAESAAHSTEQLQQQLREVTASRADAIQALVEVQEKLSAAQEANRSIMERMDDLLETNESLKEQIARLDSEAAAHHAGAARDAEELSRLRDLAAGASKQTSKETEDAKSQLRSVSEENARLRRDLDGVTANASKAAAELEKLRGSAQSWEAERSAHEEEVKHLRGALDATKEQLRALQEQHQNASKDAESTAAAQLAERLQQLHSLSEQNDKMRVSISNLQKEMREVEVNYQTECRVRAELESRAAVLMKEVAHYEEKQQEWNARQKHSTERIEELEVAVERAAQAAADNEEQHRHAAKNVEGAVAAQLAEKEQAVESLTCQLVTAEGALNALQAEVASTRHEVATLREQLRQAGDAGEAKLAASLATAAAEHEATRQLLKGKEAAHAEILSQLSDKQRELEDFQRQQFSAAKRLRGELRALRQQCMAARETHEAERQGWQTSLAELRAALELLERPREAEVKGGAPELLSPSGAAAPNSSHKASRWAQPTRVKETTCLPIGVSCEHIPAVEGLDRWEFDTKAEAARVVVPDTLVRIGYQIAVDWLLFPCTASLQKWVNILDVVQANYYAHPYHNKVHAADVLQGVYALVQMFPGLLANMTKVEKRAVLFAAAVHDIRHPARTEVFLKHTFDATYLHYNGCRVLEQMHTATAFELLGHPELDFTQHDMDNAEALRFHGLVTDLIAGTYMGSHAALMKAWSRPLREGGAYDFKNESDRHTVLCMLLHAVDIGAQSRGVDVALKWLDVMEEMHQQGDEEAALGLPVCPGNDRSADLRKGQLCFMEMFVIPLFDLIHQYFPEIESPMLNLRVLHAHYSNALKEAPPRPFPLPVQYHAQAAQEKVAQAAADERNAAAAQREAAVAKREKTLEQAVQRLRQATATIAQRKAQLTEKEARLATQLLELESSSRVLNSTHASLQTEEELLRATNAVIQREEAVQRKAAELEVMTAAMEEREAATSQLSSQLATIAERVNQRRQLLRYREARLRAQETALHSMPSGEGHSGLDAFNASSNEASASSQHPRSSLHRTEELSRLMSAMDKLNSAMHLV
ncbi:putative 3' 5'-cyclic nucleotide phosphodiesterase [Leptomonas seymouri]|uniref:Putative 3' 5'-cyclic nucleotide phosphodiesterase n=1 Tax=Leptomonas seymouri TaxID=5684 RepID=A0A0N1I536_LEPSE|nr:putative 3' 5'-cyclic nucleotide phosphodiesterase [Leptomonas seymouri]|eukprot:KPI87721.1 putative 3' 5'-cyclic nucleotide phosphodiesterase [Leptomonas seymouri]